MGSGRRGDLESDGIRAVSVSRVMAQSLRHGGRGYDDVRSFPDCYLDISLYGDVLGWRAFGLESGLLAFLCLGFLGAEADWTGIEAF